MKRPRYHSIGPCLIAAFVLGGCLNDPPLSSNSDDRSDPALSPVTTENAPRISRGAAQNAGTLPGTQGNLKGILEALTGFENSAASGDGAHTVTPECENDGSMSVSFSSGRNMFFYSADNCLYRGTIYNGTFGVSFGEDWDKYPLPDYIPSLEMVFAGAPEFTSTGATNFSIAGGYEFRMAARTPGLSQPGEHFYAFEYGATEEGLQVVTDLGSFSMAPGAFYRWTTSFTVDLVDKEIVRRDFSRSMSSGGTFELEEDAFYKVTFEGVRFSDKEAVDLGSAGVDDFELGATFCPVAGTMAISGADNTETTVYFGADAGDTYEVVLMGPEGQHLEYLSCDHFYRDNPIVGIAD